MAVAVGLNRSTLAPVSPLFPDPVSDTMYQRGKIQEDYEHKK